MFTRRDQRIAGWVAVASWALAILAQPFPWLINSLPAPIAVFVALSPLLAPLVWAVTWMNQAPLTAEERARVARGRGEA